MKTSNLGLRTAVAYAFFGKVDVTLNLVGLLVPCTLYVLENLINPLLFGMDILKELQANIDFASNRISFYNNLVTLYKILPRRDHSAQCEINFHTPILRDSTSGAL